MRSILTLFILVSISSFGISQKFEIGLFGGIANYSGDINKENILMMTEINSVYGIQLKRNITQSFSVGIEYMNAKLSGSDQNFTDRMDWDPNLSFKTTVNELNLNFQWTPFNKRTASFYDADGYKFSYNNMVGTNYNEEGLEVKQVGKFFIATDKSKNLWVYNKEGDLTIYTEDYLILNQKYNKRLSPYFFAGAGVVFASPTLLGMPEDMPEMQPGHYGKIHATTPFGGGFLFDLHPSFNINMEITMRYAFTDYLDGVSVSRNPDNMDWYLFAGLRFSYSFGKIESYKAYLSRI